MNNKDKLAVEAGFDYDSRDGNLYHKSYAQYLNRELYAYVRLVIASCSECVRQELHDKDSVLDHATAARLQKRMRDEFGIE